MCYMETCWFNRRTDNGYECAIHRYVVVIIADFFFGSAPQLVNEDLVYSPADRFRLRTATAGTVLLRVSVITRDFGKYGVKLC